MIILLLQMRYILTYLKLINDYGWSESGKPTIFDKNVPTKIVNKRITIIACVSRTKKIGYNIYDKSVNSECFCKYIKHISKKTNKKHYYLDKASIHTARNVRDTLKSEGINPIYGVPKNPQFN